MEGGKEDGMEKGIEQGRKGGKVPAAMCIFLNKDLPHFLSFSRGAQRKVLDIMNTLGLSNTVM